MLLKKETVIAFLLSLFCQTAVAQFDEAYLAAMADARKKKVEIDSLAGIGQLKKADVLLEEVFLHDAYGKAEMKASLMWSISTSLADSENVLKREGASYYCNKFITLIRKNYRPASEEYFDYHLRALRIYQNQLSDTEKADELYVLIKKMLPVYFEDCKYSDKLRGLIALSESKKDYDLCEKLFERDINCKEELNGRDYGGFAETTAFYALFSERMGKQKKADKLFKEFIRSYKAFFSKDGKNFAVGFIEASNFYIQTRRYKITHMLLNEAETEFRKDEKFSSLGDNYLRLLSLRAMTYYYQDKVEKSISIFEQSVLDFEKAEVNDHSFLKEACINLSYLYKKNNQTEKATAIAEKYPRFFE